MHRSRQLDRQVDLQVTDYPPQLQVLVPACAVAGDPVSAKAVGVLAIAWLPRDGQGRCRDKVRSVGNGPIKRD